MQEWRGNHYEEVTKIIERQGSHVLEVTYYDNYANVKVEDLSSFRFPLLYADTMKKDQANSYLELFKKRGYVEIPIPVE